MAVLLHMSLCSIQLCNFYRLSHDVPAQQKQEITLSVPNPSLCEGVGSGNETKLHWKSS